VLNLTKKTFEQVWLDILDFAKNQSTIKTLVQEVRNDIISTDDKNITVKCRRTGNERVLWKDDFQYAWKCLESKNAITLQDIEPRLRGRKSIIFAFLAKSLSYVNWKKVGSSPLTIYLIDC